MKKFYLLPVILVTILVLSSMAFAPLQTETAPPGDSAVPIMLAIAITGAVSYLVTEGLKRLSEKMPGVPNIAGYGTVIAAGITSAMLLWAGQGLSYLPPEFQTPVGNFVATIATLSVPYALAYLRKRFAPPVDTPALK